MAVSCVDTSHKIHQAYQHLQRKDAETKDSSENIKPTKAGVKTSSSTAKISGSTPSADHKKRHMKRQMKRHMGDSVGDSVESVKPARKAAHKQRSKSPVSLWVVSARAFLQPVGATGTGESQCTVHRTWSLLTN